MLLRLRGRAEQGSPDGVPRRRSRASRAPLLGYGALAAAGAVALLIVASARDGRQGVTYRTPTVVAALARQEAAASGSVVSLSAAPRLALAARGPGAAKRALAPPARAPAPAVPVPLERPEAVERRLAAVGRPGIATLGLDAAPPDGPAAVRPVALVRPPPAPPPAGAGAPRLAVVIDDLGYDPRAARRAIRLPARLTMAFLPYGVELGPLTAEAEAAGHDVFLHLPMEPVGAEDPGPNAVLTGLEPAELGRRLAWAFARVPRAVGVNNHMGSRATADPGLMLRVLTEVGRRGLFFVDSRTSAVSAAAGVARRLGLPHAARDVFLDNEPERAAVLARLAEAERVARRKGQALAIGHPFAATLGALEEWLPGARRRGLRLVGARELGAAGDGACSLVATAGAGC